MFRTVSLATAMLLVVSSLFASIPYSDSPEGAFDNPALLNPEYSEFLYSNLSDSSFNNLVNRFLFNLNGLGIGYTDSKPLKEWDFALSFRSPDDGGNLGFAVRRVKFSFDDRFRTFYDAGAVLRPTKYFSLGASVKNINQPEIAGIEILREYRVGLAVRPFLSWHLTLYSEAELLEREKFDDMDYRAGAEIHPIKGIRLFGEYDKDKNITFGARIDIPNIGVGYGAKLDSSSNLTSHKSYVHLSDHQFKTIFRPRHRTIKLTLSGNISERPKRSFFSRSRSVHEIISEIHRAKEDAGIDALVIVMDSPSIGLAQAEELRCALVDFRSAGKKIFVYSDYLDNISCYLASAADKVVMNPAGTAAVTGVSAQLFFVRGTLEKLGVTPEYLQAGKYKSAAEMFTRDSMSAESREETERLLVVVDSILINQIAEARGMSVDSLRSIVDNSPHPAEDAVALGLVDTLMYKDEFVKKFYKKQKLDFSRYTKDEFVEYRWGIPKKLAIVWVDGGINSDMEKRLTRSTKKVVSDKSIKGMLLRVNSPGGGAFSSDVIWHGINRVKDKDKPVVVSMGGSAASGGYYVSSPGDFIFADKTSITGSIGVIMGKFSLKGMLRKIGANSESITYSKSAGTFSLFDSWNEHQKSRMEYSIRKSYDMFKSRVLAGRKNLTADSLEAIAQGRVWIGTDAHSIGLVDSIGDFRDALEYTKKLCGIKKGDKVDYVYLPKSNIIERIRTEMMETAIQKLLKEDEEILYLAPTIRIR